MERAASGNSWRVQAICTSRADRRHERQQNAGYLIAMREEQYARVHTVAHAQRFSFTVESIRGNGCYPTPSRTPLTLSTIIDVRSKA